jgi:hypothetical protein
MVKILKAFWRSLAFVGTLVGLLFLASNFQDLPDAIAGWQGALAMIERETALAIFALLALLYIIWIDVRPLLQKSRGAHVWQKLRIGSGHLSFAGLSDDEHSATIQLAFDVHNECTDDPIFFEATRADLSIEERINTEASLAGVTVRVEPQKSARFQVAAIRDLPRKDLYGGRVELELRYGAEESDLRFQLTRTSSLRIQLIDNGFPNIKYDIDATALKLEHTRLR